MCISPPSTPRLTRLLSYHGNSPQPTGQRAGQENTPKQKILDETESEEARVSAAAASALTKTASMTGVSQSSSLKKSQELCGSFKKVKHIPQESHSSVDPGYLARLFGIKSSNPGKSDPDRFIPDRQLLSLPPAESVFEPAPPLPKNYSACELGSALSNELLGISADPSLFPILRKSDLNIEPPHRRLPRLGKNEVYSDKTLKTLDLPEINGDFYQNIFSISNATNRFAIVLGAQICIYDFMAQAVLPLFPQDDLSVDNEPTALSFNQAGDYLAVGKKDGSVELWAVNNDSFFMKWSISPAAQRGKTADRVLSAAFLGDDLFVGDDQGRLFKIDVETGICAKSWKIHKSRLCSIAISSDGAYLATGGNDDKIVIRNAATMEKIKVVQMNAAVKAIAFDPTGKPRIAFGRGHEDPRICLMDFSDPQTPKISDLQMSSQVTNLIWWKNRLISTHNDGSYQVTPLQDLAPDFLGFPTKINAYPEGRILTAGVWKRGNDEFLLLGNSELERFDIFALPKPEKPKPVVKSGMFESFLRSIR